MRRKLVALLLTLVFSLTFVCPALGLSFGGHSGFGGHLGSSSGSLSGLGSGSSGSTSSSIPGLGGLGSIGSLIPPQTGGNLPTIPGIPSVPGGSMPGLGDLTSLIGLIPTDGSIPAIPGIPSVPGGSLPTIPGIPSTPGGNMPGLGDLTSLIGLIPTDGSIPAIPGIPSTPGGNLPGLGDLTSLIGLIPTDGSLPAIPGIPSTPGGNLPGLGDLTSLIGLIPTDGSIPAIPGIPSVPGGTIPSIPGLSDLPTLPGIPTDPTQINFEQIAALIQSDQFSQGLAQYLMQNLGNMSPTDLQAIEALVPKELIKELYTAMKTNDQAKLKTVLEQISAKLAANAPQLMAKFAPMIADYAADALADKLISAGYPGTKAELKAKLAPVILGVLTGQVPPNTEAITQKLIAQGVDAKFAPYLAYGIALMTSDQMIGIISPIAAVLIVDLIGKAIGVPLPAAIKSQLVAKLTPIVEAIIKGMVQLALSQQSSGSLGTGLLAGR